MNIGFLEAKKQDEKFNCFIFHDVDILPEDSRNFYTCEFTPLHLGSCLSREQYK